MDAKHEEFIKDLVKGKIAEIIFEQMFRESDNYTILPCGYESTLPELAQYQRLTMVQDVIDNFRHAPDFVLISQNKKEVYLVEVKYRSNPDAEELKEICEETLKHWDPAWLFVASPNGFFFEPCHKVLNNNGHMDKFIDEKFATDQVRSEYLELLKKLEPRV